MGFTYYLQADYRPSNVPLDPLIYVVIDRHCLKNTLSSMRFFPRYPVARKSTPEKGHLEQPMPDLEEDEE